MPKYIIERRMKGVGLLSDRELQEAGRRSNDALRPFDGKVHWLHSYMTKDATFCVYVAPDELSVKKHAELAGMPADRIIKVETVIDPSVAEPREARKAA